jgi:hypothetical protein
MSVFGGGGSLSPTNSVLESTLGVTASATNSLSDPSVNDPTLEIPLTFTSWRTNINFTGAIMVTAGLPPTLMGNYHLSSSSSPAFNLGAASKSSVSAPAFDIDNQTRPQGGAFDAGADEIVVAAPGTVSFTSATTATLSGTTLAFGNRNGSVSSTVTLTIGGGTPVTFTTATVTNSIGTAFSKGTDTCSGTTKAVGATCTIVVNFNGPSGNNTRTGTLTVPHNGTNSPAVLNLTGS